MEPTLLGTAFIEGGPDRKIKLDRNPGVDEVICVNNYKILSWLEKNYTSASTCNY